MFISGRLLGGLLARGGLNHWQKPAILAFYPAPSLGCTAPSLNARLCALQQEPGALLAPVFGLQFWRRVHASSLCFSFSVDSGAQAAAWVLLRISPAWLRIICSALSCLGPLKSSLSALALCECKENMLGPYLKPLAPPGAACIAPQL